MIAGMVWNWFLVGLNVILWIIAIMHPRRSVRVILAVLLMRFGL